MTVQPAYGLVDQVPVPTGSTGAATVQDTIALARRVEALGFTHYWLAEHHSTNSFACAAPAVLMAAVAGATERLRVGSGGVLLPHYSPLHVAEQFRMLEALFPGRIHLGVGRAPGGTHGVVNALQYGRGAIPHTWFPQQVQDLIGWMGDDMGSGHPFEKVRAMPRGTAVPPVWILGSSGETAAMAAEFGCGYAFAQFITGADGSAAARRYRADFTPGVSTPAPQVAVAVGVLCADTDDEAERLATSLRLWRARIEMGRDRGIPSPEEAASHDWSPNQKLRVHDGQRVVIGTPDKVARGVDELAARYDADLVLTVTVTHDPAARRRSYELLAGALGLSAP